MFKNFKKFFIINNHHHNMPSNDIQIKRMRNSQLLIEAVVYNSNGECTKILLYIIELCSLILIHKYLCFLIFLFFCSSDINTQSVVESLLCSNFYECNVDMANLNLDRFYSVSPRILDPGWRKVSFFMSLRYEHNMPPLIYDIS